jgi:hypothetical protein
MRKIALFAAAVAVFVVIGFDTWLSVRTITPGALAGSTFNRLITAEKGSPISHYDDYLFVPHSGESDFAIFTAIRGALDHCTSHDFGFFGGSPHSHLPVC